jgi:hypothetical protein
VVAPLIWNLDGSSLLGAFTVPMSRRLGEPSNLYYYRVCKSLLIAKQDRVWQEFADCKTSGSGSGILRPAHPRLFNLKRVILPPTTHACPF